MESGRMENRQLFALGGVYPRGWADRPAEMLAECLIEGDRPEVEIEARFEQTVERQILDASGKPVEELLVTGRRYSQGEEEHVKAVRLSELPDRTAVLATAGSERMELIEGGAPVGTVLWRASSPACTPPRPPVRRPRDLAPIPRSEIIAASGRGAAW
jgi:hypothetical protein